MIFINCDQCNGSGVCCGSSCDECDGRGVQQVEFDQDGGSDPTINQEE